MKIRPKPLILGSMLSGGVGLTVAGTRQLSGYISSITIGESATGMPPGFMLIVLGSASLSFSLGHITGELIGEHKAGKIDLGT